MLSPFRKRWALEHVSPPPALNRYLVTSHWTRWGARRQRRDLILLIASGWALEVVRIDERGDQHGQGLELGVTCSA